MPDDKTNQREAHEDQAASAESPKAESPNNNADSGAQLGVDLEALLNENAEMRDRLLRTMADMENLRRRTEREKADTASYAISNFARDVLTVGDNLKRTIEHVPAEAAAQGALLPSIEKSRPTRPSCAPALRGTRASLPPARPATARLATARLSPPTSIAQ